MIWLIWGRVKLKSNKEAPPRMAKLLLLRDYLQKDIEPLLLVVFAAAALERLAVDFLVVLFFVVFVVAIFFLLF